MNTIKAIFNLYHTTTQEDGIMLSSVRYLPKERVKNVISKSSCNWLCELAHLRHSNYDPEDFGFVRLEPITIEAEFKCKYKTLLNEIVQVSKKSTEEWHMDLFNVVINLLEGAINSSSHVCDDIVYFRLRDSKANDENIKEVALKVKITKTNNSKII